MEPGERLKLSESSPSGPSLEPDCRHALRLVPEDDPLPREDLEVAEDLRPALPPDRLREAVVVDVAVGQDDSLDIRGCEADLPELGPQGLVALGGRSAPCRSR
ncbi:MAG: hypothetical protein A3K59_05655 [Euryarchaeota archaeon RBG_19FT_COMBO_69_17]|nr:MAG: hypothetical protein A3K59_05655 [Euryarchaeota archaeon RBG_19FT_COMBO_69_17]